MILSSIELATRIERAERLLVEEGVAPTIAAETCAFRREIAGGLATYAFAGSPYNKIVGCGFGDPLDESALAAIESAYRERQSRIVFEVSSLADPSIGSALTRRGYELLGFEDVLGIALPYVPRAARSPGSSIELCDESLFDAWCTLMIDAFATSDDSGIPAHEIFDREPLERTIRAAGANPNCLRLAARRNGELAAGATLGLHDGIAQLCGSATLPAHRRNGLQTLLLEDRLRRASELGCELAVVTTSPGTKSQHNARRLGFEMLYTRAILARE